MSSFPPYDYDPSRSQNPFQAPQSGYLPEGGGGAAAGAPQPIVFGELFGKVFETAVAKAPLFLFSTFAMGILSALGAVVHHYFIRPMVQPPADPIEALPFVLALYLLLGVIAAWIFIGLTKLWLETCMGRNPGVETVFSGGRWLLTGIGLNIVTTVAVSVGMIFCCIPGLWVAAVTGAALSVAIMENRGVFDALSRSHELTSGSAGAIALTFFCLVLVAMTIGTPFALAAPAIGSPIGEVILAFPQAAAALLLLIMNVLVYCMATGTPVVLRSSNEWTGDQPS